jgi:murein DD-endopeptidase MepM/ murein hydrolase activator NlpD
VKNFLAIFLAIFLLVLGVNGAIAQTTPGPVGSTIQGNEAELDWNFLTVGDIPRLSDGQSFASTVDMEDYPAVGEMTLGQVSGSATIGNNAALAEVKVGDLVDSVDGLSEKKVSEAPAIGKIIENYAVQKGLDIGFKYADKYIGKVFDKIPELKGIPIGQFSGLLSGDPLSAIPGLADVAMKKIPGLDKVSLDKIPGLDKIPLKDIMDLAKYSPVAILNHIWSKEETQSVFKSVSGSKEEGWSVPCTQTSCGYSELADYRGSLESLPYSGARWNLGGPKKALGQQMVKGGSGVMGATFGGKEPTGRALGNDLKIVLTNVDQSKGSVDFSLYTHACTKHAGCSPFIFGPIPFYTTTETNLVFMGVPNYNLKKKNLGKLAGASKWLDKAQMVADAYDPSGAGGEGSSELGRCADKALAVVDPDDTDEASTLVPTLISESLGGGLDANQTAFLLAATEKEYGYKVDSSEVLSKYKAIAKANINSKVVNYYGAAKDAGLSSDVAERAAKFQEALKPCQNAACDSSGQMARPSQGAAVSEFGMRLSPTLGVWKLHAGIDLGDGTGAPIRAADCGTVEYVGWEDGYGQVVVIKHSRYFTRSAHTSAQFVRKGQKVGKGQHIANAGATGRVTGPHVHFEVREGGSFGTPLNPRQFIPV